MTDDELDRLIRASAPTVTEPRVERAVRTVLARRDRALVAPAAFWTGVLSMPQGVAYVGLFVLGCLVNLAVRQPGQTALDLMLPAVVQLPWGG